MKTLPRFIFIMCLAAVLVFLGLKFVPAFAALNVPFFLWLLPFSFIYDLLAQFSLVKNLQPLTYNERAMGFFIAAIFLFMLIKLLPNY